MQRRQLLARIFGIGAWRRCALLAARVGIGPNQNASRLNATLWSHLAREQSCAVRPARGSAGRHCHPLRPRMPPRPPWSSSRRNSPRDDTLSMHVHYGAGFSSLTVHAAARRVARRASRGRRWRQGERSCGAARVGSRSADPLKTVSYRSLPLGDKNALKVDQLGRRRDAPGTRGRRSCRFATVSTTQGDGSSGPALVIKGKGTRKGRGDFRRLSAPVWTPRRTR